MRISDDARRFIHFDRNTDEMPPEVWTQFDGRRMRFQPDSLSIYWQTDRETGEWKLWRVAAYGRRCHKTAGWTLSHVFYEATPMCVTVDPETPEWVLQHVAMSFPGYTAVVHAAVLELINILFGGSGVTSDARG